jgi:hypothetical protein
MHEMNAYWSDYAQFSICQTDIYNVDSSLKGLLFIQ